MVHRRYRCGLFAPWKVGSCRRFPQSTLLGRRSCTADQRPPRIRSFRLARWTVTAWNSHTPVYSLFQVELYTQRHIAVHTFYPRDVLSGVLATATCASVCLSVRHSRYCIKTTKPILKLFRPSGSSIVEAFGTAPILNSKGNPFIGGV